MSVKTFVYNIFSAANKTNSLKIVSNNLKALTYVFDKGHELRRMFLNLKIPITGKLSIAKQISTKLSLHRHTKDLLMTLVRQNKFGLMPEIAETYEQIMTIHRKEIPFEIRTGKKLAPQYIQELISVLKDFIRDDQKICAKIVIDSKIKSGVIVRIEDLLIPVHSLRQLRQHRGHIMQKHPFSFR